MSQNVTTLMLVLLCFTGCSKVSEAESSLIGVWQVEEIEFISPSDTSTNPNPQPSQAVFTTSHYSLVWMPGTTGMRAFQQRWVPTDAEMIQRYGEIVVNSGVYTVESDSLLTLRPVISRVPEFMDGGRLQYGYRLVGDTLWLTSLDEYSFDGVQAPWAAAGNRVALKLIRVERM
jgi:hypothetical protein